MSDLEVVLSWLGMSRYLDRLQDAGFDTWDIVMEITEKDLEVSIIMVPLFVLSITSCTDPQY